MCDRHLENERKLNYFVFRNDYPVFMAKMVKSIFCFCILANIRKSMNECQSHFFRLHIIAIALFNKCFRSVSGYFRGLPRGNEASGGLSGDLGYLRKFQGFSGVFQDVSESSGGVSGRYLDISGEFQGVSGAIQRSLRDGLGSFQGCFKRFQVRL